MEYSRIYFNEEHKDQVNKFFDSYTIEKFIDVGDLSELYTIGNKTKGCRFCSQKEPFVTFRNVAHLAPQVLGNRFFISGFECDSCNKRFGRYETELHNFLNLSRVFNHFDEYKNITYHSAGARLIAKANTSITNTPHALFYTNDFEQQIFDVNEATGEFKFQFETGSYRPLSIYKSFVKMGLSLVADDECLNYSRAFKFLCSRKYDELFKEYYQILEHQYDYGFAPRRLMLVLYKKIQRNAAIPTHMLEIHYSNHVYQVFLPFNTLDEKYYDDIEFNYRPPVYPSVESLKSYRVRTQNIDLSSTVKIRDKKTVLGKISPEELRNAISTPAKDLGLDLESEMR